MNQIIARWQDWDGRGLEHLVLSEAADEISVDSVIIATVNDRALALRYRVLCDTSWRVTKAEIGRIGEDSKTRLVSDRAGNWLDGAGKPLTKLKGAIDIDISTTPFTNTLPIRRLGLEKGSSSEILAIYIQLPALTITTDRQRYTCIEPGKRYLYESVDSDFTREIEVDRHGLVVTYPGLFRRVM